MCTPKRLLYAYLHQSRKLQHKFAISHSSSACALHRGLVIVGPTLSPQPLRRSLGPGSSARTPTCQTVNRRFRYTDYPRGEIVPVLRMSGRWLEERGFGIGGNSTSSGRAD